VTLRQKLAGKRFGLVLSAGYFGFFGHAGFLSGLAEAGLSPSAYAGSSAGGLVGGLAAAGMAPARIIELLLDLKRADFWDPDPLGALQSIALGRGHGGTGLLRGRHFQALLERALPVASIEACPTPVALAATNLSRGEVAIFRSGALAPRIVASCAYPGMFRAIELEGELFWDGGLVDKAPLLALADWDGLKLDALLVHYLPSHGRASIGGLLAYAQGLDIGMTIARREHFKLQLEVAQARGLPVYVVSSELPKVSPRKLGEGASAVVAGRAAAARALAGEPLPFQANR